MQDGYDEGREGLRAASALVQHGGNKGGSGLRASRVGEVRSDCDGN